MYNNFSAHGSSIDSMPAFSAQEIAILLAKDPEKALTPTHEQQRIIELFPQGSALVVAGAGSGKTETLANRVVWLIANGLCAPEEVLGLTFTVKAAGELNERIRKQLRAFSQHARDRQSTLTDQQHQRLHELETELAGGLNVPQVSTYNSFAAGIVTEFGPYAGIGVATTILDQPAAEELALELVLSSEDPRLLALDISADSLAKDLITFEHEASEHLVTSLAQPKRITQEFTRVGTLPYSDKNPTTEKTYAEIRKLLKQVAEKKLVADLAMEYRQAKMDRGFIEFSDQVAFAQQIALELPAARDTLKDRYRVILLDEVQDTSVGQTRLLSNLFQGSAVMGVGDPHQSIYAWRGAAADALDSFHQHFAAPGKLGEGAELALSTSWRNPRVVLQAANHVSAPLRAVATIDVPVLRPREHAESGTLNTEYFETKSEELDALAQWIKAQRHNREQAQQPLPTVAVLVRNKNNMFAISEALREQGVPSHVVGLGGLLSTPEVTDVVSVLECVDGTHASNALLRVLASPRFNVGIRDIAALSDVSRWLADRDISQRPLSESDIAEDRILPDPDRNVTNIDALDAIRTMPDTHAALGTITARGRHALREAAHMLHRLRRLTSGKISELIRACEQELFLDIELAVHPRKESMTVESDPAKSGRVDPRANLDLFVSEVSRAEKLLTQPSLKAVLAWIRRSAEADDFEAATPAPSRHTVQILTIHKAKGLEWDVVALPGMREGRFPGKDRDASGWLSRPRLPDELRGDRSSRPQFEWRLSETQQELRDRFHEYKRERGEFHELEERRLVYVAITRAKQNLWMSGAFWDTQQSAMPPSHYITELREIGLGNRIPEQTAHTHKPENESTHLLHWPLPALGTREEAVRASARAVEQALADPTDQHTNIQIPKEIEVLLAEQVQQRADAVRSDETTDRINASAFHNAVNDPAQTLKDARRPVPQRPYRGADIGNRFHEWVEARFTTAQGSALTIAGMDESLFDADADLDLVSVKDPDDQLGVDAQETGRSAVADHVDEPVPTRQIDARKTLEQLKTNFEKSRWATRQARAVELEITVPFAGQRLVCKLDAVFEQETDDGTRIEIVDWKTGRAPRTTAEQRDRFYQLDLYRHAYALWSRTDPKLIDAVLYYVADDRELSMPMQHTLAELEDKWIASQHELDGD